MSAPTNPPAGRGSTPLHDPERKKRPWWLLLLLAIVVVALLLFLLSRCGGDSSSSKSSADSTASPTAGGTATASSTPTPSPASSPTTGAPTASASPAPASSPAPAGAAGGSLTAGGTSLLPLTTSAPRGSLAKYNGTNAQAAGVRVLSVPADEGFWVGSSRRNRLWVQISGAGESPYHVKAGDKVDFTGTVVTNPAGFAKKVGVSPAEGAKQLTSEASHIEVKQGAVKLSKS